MINNRRQFLQNCIGGMTLPWLINFDRQVSYAQSSGYPLRLLCIFSPHGTQYRKWRPQAVAGNTQDFNIGYERAILGPLQSYKSNMVILDGVDYRVLYEVNATGHEGGMGNSS